MRKQAADTEEKIRTLAKRREELQIVADYYRVRADKYEVLGNCPSLSDLVISGYIPAAVADKVAEKLMSKYDCMVDVEELEGGRGATGNPEEQLSPPIWKASWSLTDSR